MAGFCWLGSWLWRWLLVGPCWLGSVVVAVVAGWVLLGVVTPVFGVVLSWLLSVYADWVLLVDVAPCLPLFFVCCNWCFFIGSVACHPASFFFHKCWLLLGAVGMCWCLLGIVVVQCCSWLGVVRACWLGLVGWCRSPFDCSVLFVVGGCWLGLVGWRRASSGFVGCLWLFGVVRCWVFLVVVGWVLLGGVAHCSVLWDVGGCSVLFVVGCSWWFSVGFCWVASRLVRFHWVLVVVRCCSLLGVVGGSWLGLVGCWWFLGVVRCWVLSMGLVGCHRALFGGCSVLFVVGCRWRCWALLGVVSCCLGIVGCCWVLLGAVGCWCCWLLSGVGCSKGCWVLLCIVGCWVVLVVGGGLWLGVVGGLASSGVGCWALGSWAFLFMLELQAYSLQKWRRIEVW